MAKHPVFPMWVQDYLADTSHLDATEHGVYHLLLYRYWLTDGRALPDDMALLRRVAKCRTRATVERILAEFWQLSTGEGWHHKRAKLELRVTRDRKVAARESAKKRWKINDRAYANASNPQCSPTPTPTPEEKKEEKLKQKEERKPSASLGFEDWWKAYPKKVGKAPCLAIWKRRRLGQIADRLIADILRRAQDDGRWLDGYIPNPQTYLNQSRWEDELQPRSKKPEKLKRGNGAGGQPSWQQSIDAMAAQLGMSAKPGESYEAFGARLRAAATRAH